MEDAKNIFDSFKEFIWDILIYLLPGLFLLIALSVCVNSKYYFSSSLIIKDKFDSTLIIIVVGYILGHVITGIGWLKDFKIIQRLLGQSYRVRIENSIMQREDFKACKNIVRKKMQENSPDQSFPSLTLRDVKNVVMNYFPEVEKQIYTFSFRSEFCNHISNVCFVLGIVGLLNLFIFKVLEWNLEIFKTDRPTFVFYILLFTGGVLLRFPRNRFYELSQRLAFGKYMAKDLLAPPKKDQE